MKPSIPKQPHRQPATRPNAKADAALDAAQGLFGAHGYGATSMDAVATKAGVSKATVYAHFKNKQQLFAAMVQRECDRCIEKMAIPNDVHDLALEAALKRIADAFLQILVTPRILAIFCVVIAEGRRFPELGRIFYESGPGVTFAGVVNYIERTQALGLIRQDCPRQAAYQFLGMLRGDLQLRALLGLVEEGELERTAQAAVDTFLRAYVL